MAHVVLTQELQRAVLRRCEEMFSKRIEEASKFFMDEKEAGELVLDAVLAPYLNSWSALPKDFLYQDETVNFSKINNYTSRFSRTSLPLRAKKAVPHRLRQTRIYPMYDPEPVYSPLLTEFVDKWKIQEEGWARVVNELEEFKQKIKKFMLRHNSLGQALKEWPQFQELVPQEYMDRFNKKVDKKGASEKAALDIDLDELNGTVTIAKIVEG